MVNNRLVRDSNSAKLGGKKNTTKKNQNEGKPIEVTHTNAPLLTVKYLELLLIELRKLTAKLEKVDG
jgi:hypothetical protein